MKYLIVIEETATGFSAYSPDVSGCIATGASRKEVEKNIKEALEFHLEGLALEKLEIPQAHAYSNYVDIIATPA
jgi:predicted RNase H-like HicB family nuclease